ncbi:hypothetical protein [Flammeovirga agarivorans]|uniref:Uncharacterized protein n=1 Tax=Flammeovirga agarivorans TaxID=2726742 RepID=A0A7X8XZC9_9BACT|nr:hypothetical protein [Flammeovirga agarivorans]NLR94865.1 hypothetical protein [Flammeovirga agarivorans]
MKTIKLDVTYSFSGDRVEEATLLPINGAAEKIFTKRNSEKPFSWFANVISAGCSQLGRHSSAEEVRKKFAESGDVKIPQVVLAMPMAVANTLLLEIHRHLWEDLLENQEVICKYCTKTLAMDVDLHKIDYSEEDYEKIDEADGEFDVLTTKLTEGYVYKSPKKRGELVEPELDGITFNQFEFRAPTLRDCIQHENSYDDDIEFWRKIAMNCIIGIKQVSDSGEIISELPSELFKRKGLKVFDQIFRKDLQAIRNCVRDEIPALSFAYEDTCACSMSKQIPVSAQSGNLFSS